MLLLASIAPNAIPTLSKQLEVEQPGVGAFLFHIDSLTGMDYGNVLSVLNQIEVTAHYNRKTGQQINIANRRPLLELVQYDASGEGCIRLGQSAPGFVETVDAVFSFCEAGGLDMQDDETLYITLYNLPNSNEMTISCYGLEHPVSDPVLLKYEGVTVPTGSKEKTFNLQDATAVIFPASTILDTAQISYTNGKDCRFTEPELRALAARVNDTVAAGNQGINDPNGLYHVLDVENASSMRLTTNGNAFNFCIVRPIVAASPVVAASKNASLTSTLPASMVNETNSL